MAYPTPTNITGVGGIATYLVAVEGSFFTLLMVVLWLIIFLAMRVQASSSIAVPFAVASLVSFVLSLALLIGDLIHFPIVVIFLAMFAISIIWVLNEV